MATKLDEAAIKALATQYAPGMEEAVRALSMIESSGGRNDDAYTPNSVGAIGPMQILSKQLGGKYGNFEQYAVPGKTDPLNPEHSTIAGIRMFADLMKKNANGRGQDGAVLEYFTGKPYPNPKATDGLTTAAKYLENFNRALYGGGNGRGFVNPPSVSGDASLPSLATPGFNPQASQPGAAPLDTQELLRQAVEGIKANAQDNRKSMGTFGMDDKQPNSAVVAGGANSAANIKAMAELFARNNARYSGPEFDAKNPVQRLFDQVFGGFKDQAAFQRIQGQLGAMQGALDDQQRLTKTQQTLNTNAAPDTSKVANIAAILDARQQAADASVERAQILADSRKEVQQMKASQASTPDALLQYLEPSFKALGMPVPPGMKVADYAKLLGPETMAAVTNYRTGGSIGADAVDSISALNNPGLPQELRTQGAELSAFVNAAANSPEFKSSLKGYLPGDKNSESMKQQQLKQFVAQNIAKASKGEKLGFTLPKDVSNPYELNSPYLASQLVSKGLTSTKTADEGLNALIRSNISSVDVANIFANSIKDSKYEVFGAPARKAVIRDPNINGGKELDLTLPQNIDMLRAIQTANMRKRAEGPQVFASLEELFGIPASDSANLIPSPGGKN